MEKNYVFILIQNKINRKNYTSKKEIVDIIDQYYSYEKLTKEEYKELIDMLK